MNQQQDDLEYETKVRDELMQELAQVDQAIRSVQENVQRLRREKDAQLREQASSEVDRGLVRHLLLDLLQTSTAQVKSTPARVNSSARSSVGTTTTRDDRSTIRSSSAARDRGREQGRLASESDSIFGLTPLDNSEDNVSVDSVSASPRLTYRLVTEIVNASSSYARSTITKRFASETVGDLVQNAASLWALDSRYVQAMYDGLLLNRQCSLGMLESLLGPRTSPLEVRQIHIHQAKPIGTDLTEHRTRNESHFEVHKSPTEGMTKKKGSFYRFSSQRQKTLAGNEAFSAYVKEPGSRPSFFRHLRDVESRADAIRDLLTFLIILLLLLTGYTMPSSRYTRGKPLNDITEQPFTNKRRFVDIQTSEDIYLWTNSVLRSHLLKDALESISEGQSVDSAAHWTLNDGMSEVVGVLRVRQLRVRANVSCAVTTKAEYFIDACYANYASENRAVETFGGPSVAFTNGFEWVSSQDIQAAANTSMPQMYTLDGSLADYPNSGFLVDIGATFRRTGAYADLVSAWDAVFDKFELYDWIDEQTSAVVFSWNDFIGSAARYESNHVLFEQRLTGQFVPTLKTDTFQRSLVLPEGGSGAAQALSGVFMLWIALQKIFRCRAAWRHGDVVEDFFLKTVDIFDLATLALYICSASMQIYLNTYFESFQTLLWASPTYYYPLEDLIQLADAQRIVMNVVIFLVSIRLLFSLRLFEAGSVILLTLYRTSKSAAATLAVFLPFFMVNVLLIWQLVGNFDANFHSFRSVWLQLSLQIFSLYDLLQPTLLGLVAQRPFISWYTSILLLIHVFIFRYLLPAVITVSAIQHFLYASANHRRDAKRVAYEAKHNTLGPGSLNFQLNYNAESVKRKHQSLKYAFSPAHALKLNRNEFEDSFD